jgi:hypothetical protein
MRKFILAGLLALPCLAVDSSQVQAAGCCNGCNQTPTLNFGFGMRIGLHHWCFCEKPTINPCLPGKPHKHKHHGCSSCAGGGGYGGGHGDMSCTWGAGAPWYLFWPYDAHFRMPAPTGYPFWPAPQTIQPGFGAHYGYNMPGYQTPNMGYPMDANAVQPAGFYPQQVPTYWYGR